MVFATPFVMCLVLFFLYFFSPFQAHVSVQNGIGNPHRQEEPIGRTLALRRTQHFDESGDGAKRPTDGANQVQPKLSASEVIVPHKISSPKRFASLYADGWEIITILCRATNSLLIPGQSSLGKSKRGAASATPLDD